MWFSFFWGGVALGCRGRCGLLFRVVVGCGWGGLRGCVVGCGGVCGGVGGGVWLGVVRVVSRCMGRGVLVLK